MEGAGLDHDEQDQGGHPHDPHGALLADERVRREGQAPGAEHRSGRVDAAARRGVVGLGHVAQRDGQHGGDERQVEQEDPTPRRRAGDPAAEERTDGGGDPTEPGPGADGPGPVGGVEGRGQQRQAARGQQRSAHALHEPGGDEHLDGGSGRAHRRGRREPDEADAEHATATETVAQGPAQQDERGEGERVGGHDPLQAGEVGVQVPPEAGEGDVDDGGVERGHPRAEHGGRHHPAPGGGGEAHASGLARGSRLDGHLVTVGGPGRDGDLMVDIGSSPCGWWLLSAGIGRTD